MKKEINGKHIPCLHCNATGMRLDIMGDPDECTMCAGSGCNWQYESGKIAKWYTGPFIDYMKP